MSTQHNEKHVNPSGLPPTSSESYAIEGFRCRRQELPLSAFDTAADEHGHEYVTIDLNEELGDLAKDEHGARVAAGLGWRDPETAVCWLRDLVAADLSNTKQQNFSKRFVEFYRRIVCMQPKDETEAVLIGQSVLLESQAQHYLRLAQNSHPACATSYVNAASKLMNRQTQALELLQKKRRGNHQQITVQHVNVTSGGQAIVGHFA